MEPSELAVARKQNTERYLASLGVPINIWLPRLEDESEVVVRSAEIVAKRTIILYCLTAVAQGVESEQAIKWLQQEDIWDDVSLLEAEFFLEATLSDEDRNVAWWRIEALYALLWALGKIDRLELPTEPCDAEEIEPILPSPGTSCREYISVAYLRPIAEILDAADLIYRLDWVAVESALRGQTMTNNLSADIIHERHYALNWVLSNTDWDDVSTDT